MKSNQWESVSLSSVVDIIPGYSFKSNDFDNLSNEIVIKIKDIKPPIVDYKNADRINIKNYKINKLEKYLLYKGDILIAMTGATIGKVGRVVEDKIAYLNQRVCKVSPRENIYNNFLFYILNDLNFINHVKNHIDSETAQPNISGFSIGKYSFFLPSLPEQVEISELLNSLDIKIELNNKINKNLEEIAQTLYKRWFVDFEFPNENGEPYKSSGGEMVDSELGMIPKGWEVKEINLVIKNKKERVGLKIMPVLSAVKEGKLVLSSDFFTKNVPSSNISKYLIVGPREFSYNPARINIGSIGMNEFDFNGCVSPIYVVLKPDYIYVNFFSLYFKTSTFSDEVSLRASGSVRQSLNFDDLGRIKIVYPSKNSVIKFNEIYDSIYFGVKSNEKQIANLSKIRDELLPKLMSGEIEVPVEE